MPPFPPSEFRPDRLGYRDASADLGDPALKKAPTLLALALAGAALAGAALGTARADTVTKERFGCHAVQVTERLFQLVQAGDEAGFGQLLRASLSSGECRSWVKGTEVTVDGRTVGYACLKPAGSDDKCFWTPSSAIDPEK